ncbi:MAG: hypothetical protein D6797_08425, partial [Bdellovibrio sp.]
LITLCGEEESGIFTIIREVGIKDVYILHSEKEERKARKLEKKLNEFKVPTKVVGIKGYGVEDVFKTVALISEGREDKVLINATTGDKIGSCLLLSAAFVNGIKAVGVMNNKAMLLPVMKFSYYSMISEKKMKILRTLYGEEMALNELSKKIKISLPLMFYHIYGNGKNEGLVEMGLVEVEDRGKKTKIKISPLGRMLMCGYV